MFRKLFPASLLLALTFFAGGPHASAQAAEAPKPAAKPSTTLFVEIEGQTTSFTVGDFKSMPQKTVHVHNAATNADESYSGVLLSDLLAKCGFMADEAQQRQLTLIAEGADKFNAVYPLVEVAGAEHSGDVLVATSMEGKDLGAEGQFKLINSADKTPERWVRNLSAITVKTAGQ